ncbi:MAG: indole-3-glycerol phosphate synthase TrpC [Pseudomonadota bacterium]
MSNALTRILDYKSDEVATLKAGFGFAELEARAKDQSPTRGFSRALSETVSAGRNALICELKRKSPSAGDILAGANPAEIARDYESGGAACLSILTDGPSFGGSLADFAAVREAVGLPMLRKDFMVDPIQVVEARAHGADAILVIMAAVEDGLARELEDCAHQFDMDVLVETHNEAELERALNLRSELIGINNRDLTRMETDLAVTERLASMVPAGRHLVSESGIKVPADIARLQESDARRFLIGESLMKEDDRRTAVEALVSAGISIDYAEEHI